VLSVRISICTYLALVLVAVAVVVVVLVFGLVLVAVCSCQYLYYVVRSTTSKHLPHVIGGTGGTLAWLG
jgi:hypothetical protein